MHTRNILPVLFLGLFLGCGAPKNLVSYQEAAEAAWNAGDYSKSTQAWRSYFNQFPAVNDLDGELYARAAQAAWKAGETDQSVAWFDEARYRDFASAGMYSTLAEIFRKQENISRELSALEFLQKNFDGEVEDVNARLFTLYSEIDMTDKAVSAWEKMPQAKKDDVEHLHAWFLLNKELENREVCDSLSMFLLDRSPGNVDALEWMARKYYDKAEERYQLQMKKYEENRTRRQYHILLGQLDQVTADFKEALGYFEKLWELNPDDRPRYAGYMSNIYVRFHDEDKANYYRQLSE
jgi:tetratricopeptide (TPR) repeat protein